MKIIVSGATGFVGAHLVRHFYENGHEVIALGRKSQAPEALWKMAEYVSLDFSRDLLHRPLEADVCVHAAALTSTGSSMTEMMRVNVNGTRNLLDSVICRKFIYISSSSVYVPGLDQAEEQAGKYFDRLSSYGQSKYLAELLLHDIFAGGKHFTDLAVFRPRAIYGPGDRQLLARLQRLVKKGSFFWPGDKLAISSLTHIHNLCHACSHYILSEKSGPGTYNICDEEPYDLHDTVKMLMEAVEGRSLRTVSLPMAILLPLFRFMHGSNGRYFEIQQLNASMTLSISKLKNELGFLPVKRFSASEIADWFQKTEARKHPKETWPWL